MRIGKHYRVTGRFEGGMGVAFRCEDERQQGRVVILKTYKSGSGGDESQLRAAFTREAQVWIALHRQQYLALVEDVLLIDGRIFVEMPYYANGSLRNVLDQGPIPVERAVAFAAQLVLAMVYVSDERKILHLDLKPENILIGSSGEALITDLGLARAMHPAWGTGPAVSSLAAPQDGGVVGTVPYMSPEMIAGRGVNATADIWAWGLIVYEMVMGRRAYEGRDLRSMLKSIVSEPPLQWSKFKAQVPSDLFAVISKCLLKDPAGRFSSFGELASGLDRLIALVDAEEHVPFWNKWKKETRVRITEPLLKSHWKTRVRPHLEDGTTTRVKQTELMLLTQAQRSRKIGDTKAAILALEKLLGSESEWGKRWACLMLEREDHVFIRQHTSR